MIGGPATGLAGRILRGIRTAHEEREPRTPLAPGTPVCPREGAERAGVSPSGRRYREALGYLVEEGALEARARPDEGDGDPPRGYVLGRSAAGMMGSWGGGGVP